MVHWTGMISMGVNLPFNISLVRTGEVRGLAFPADVNGAQCSLSQLEESPCSCYGGAARMRTLLDSVRIADRDTIAIDTGSYYFGAGLFFPVFGGDASAEFFGRAVYDAFSLAWRDMRNTSWLRTYLEQARLHNPALPPAVVTNLDLSAGDGLLNAEHIVPYHLINLTGGRRLAYLSLSSSKDTGPTFAQMHTPLIPALLRTLAQLRRLPDGPPDVVACHLYWMPPPTPAEVAAAGNSQIEAERAAFDQLLLAGIGVDIWLRFIGVEEEGTSLRRNYAGDLVLVVKTEGTSFGRRLQHVTASFDGMGRLQSGEAEYAEAMSYEGHD